MGICLHALGRHEDSARAFESAILHDPRDAEAHSNLGNVLKALGRLPQAIEHYQTALSLRPDYVQAYNNLAGALHFARRHDEAIAAYRRAIALRPDYAAAYANLANVLNSIGSREEAIAMARKAVSLNSRAPQAYNNLGVILRESGHLKDAIHAFENATQIAPGFTLAWSNLALTWLQLGRFEEAIHACNHCLAIEPMSSQALAFKALALNAAQEDDQAKFFFDFDRLIRKSMIAPPANFASLESYNTTLAQYVKSRPDLHYEPVNNTTRGGWQSLDLTRDATPSPLLDYLRRMIDAAVEDYAQSITAVEHLPFRRARPQQWSLVMWTTVLQAGGFQEPHIHSDGWLSGVYYVQTPVQTAGSAAGAGVIEFGRGPASIPLAAGPVLTLSPQAGMMLLFPSYMYHSTRPHEGEQERISIAFDIVPA